VTLQHPKPADYEREARAVVRHVLMNRLDDLQALTALVRADVSPADLEAKVAEIMRYLKETRP